MMNLPWEDLSGEIAFFGRRHFTHMPSGENLLSGPYA